MAETTSGLKTEAVITEQTHNKFQNPRGAWVTQTVRCPTLDLGSGHHLMVCELELCAGLCAERPAWDSSPPTHPPAPPLRALSLSLSLLK